MIPIKKFSSIIIANGDGYRQSPLKIAANQELDFEDDEKAEDI